MGCRDGAKSIAAPTHAPCLSEPDGGRGFWVPPSCVGLMGLHAVQGAPEVPIHQINLAAREETAWLTTNRVNVLNG